MMRTLSIAGRIRSITSTKIRLGSSELFNERKLNSLAKPRAALRHPRAARIPQLKILAGGEFIAQPRPDGFSLFMLRRGLTPSYNP
jgi:hypothetical protein